MKRLVSIFFVVFTILIFTILIAYSNAVFEVEFAKQTNTNLAPLLLGHNQCNISKKAPSISDPFEVADLRIITLIPLVNNITSNNSEIFLVWSWAVELPQKVVLKKENFDCPDNEEIIFSPHQIGIKDGKLEYIFKKRLYKADLESTGPNPIKLSFQESDESNFSSLRELLNISIKGKISVKYYYEKITYEKYCDEKDCSCKKKLNEDEVEYSKELSDNKLFEVETGPVELFWINPVLSSQLSANQTDKLFLLSRRSPYFLNFEGWKNFSFYNFTIKYGKCGEALVFANFSEPEGVLKLSSANARQLTYLNATFEPFLIFFNSTPKQGQKNLSIEFEDWFSFKQNFSKIINVKEPYYKKDLEGIWRGNETTTPASFFSPKQNLQFNSFSLFLSAILATIFVFIFLFILNKQE